MIAPPQEIIEATRLSAMRSPCAKSKRGAVAFTSTSHGPQVIGAGWNGPPAPFRCDGSRACRDACSSVCVHAEVRAVVDVALGPVVGRRDLDLVHLKVIGESPVATGKPSCVSCSKLILDMQLVVGWVWLYERGTPEPECEAIYFGGHDGHTSCGAPAKHILGELGWRCDSCLEGHLRRGSRGHDHDHAKCLAEQIRSANDGATWFRYSAREFHEISLANNRLHCAKDER